MSPVVVAYHSLTIPLPIPYHSITKSISRCEGRHVGVAVYTDMSPKWQAGPLNFSVAKSYYESYRIGPPSAIRTPPPIACHRTPTNSLLPTTFWASYIYFSSYKHHVLAVICAAFWRFGIFVAFCAFCVLRLRFRVLEEDASSRFRVSDHVS